MKKITLLTAILIASNLLSAQWIQQNPHYPDSSVLYDIFFIDSQKGWANGIGPESYPELGNYYYTHDGGLNWYSCNDSIDYWFLPMNSIMFANENDGFGVWGENYYKTSDGGYHWSGSYIPGGSQYEKTDIFFIDPLHGWTIGNKPSGIGPVYWKLFSTINGGDDWIEQYQGSVGLIFTGDIKFLDEYSGWVAVGPNILFTGDGGNTWNHLTGLVSHINSIWIINEINLWTARCDLGNPSVGGIDNSTDGGLTWTQMLGDTIPGLNDITFVNEISGWAVGDSGTILHTEDGGLTWVYQASGTTADLYSISFVNENEGWICGDSSIILYTDNGGFVGINKNSISKNKLNIYPNPTNEITTITYKLEQKELIILSIVNIKGQVVKQISLGEKEKGQIDLDCSKYSSGIYFINLQTEKGILTEKLIIE